MGKEKLKGGFGKKRIRMPAGIKFAIVFFLLFITQTIVKYYLFTSTCCRSITLGKIIDKSYGSDGFELLDYSYMVDNTIYYADRPAFANYSESKRYLVVYIESIPSMSILVDYLSFDDKSKVDSLLEKKIKLNYWWYVRNN